MAFQLGRIFGLNEPMDWHSSGGKVTVTGSYRASSLLDGLQRRDQILGYINQADGDELAIPVIIDGETRVNGYYRVLSVQVLTDVYTRQRGNLYDFQVELEPVFGFANPMFESIITGGIITPNGVGAVLGDMVFLHAFPYTAGEYYKSGSAPLYQRYAQGPFPINVFLGGTVTDVARFFVPVASYYNGAALVEQGSTLATVVGRQSLLADAATLRISNGMVRVTMNGALFTVSHWNNNTVSWTTPKGFWISGTTAGQMSNVSAATVLRNSPEEVIVRLGVRAGAGYPAGRVFIDLVLRRGDRMVRGYLTTDVADIWQIKLNTVEAATAVNYGAVTTGNIRATATDADGIRYTMMSVQTAVTNDLANGKITQNAASKTFDFGMGCEINPAAPVLPDRAVDICQQYLAAQSEKMLIVAR